MINMGFLWLLWQMSWKIHIRKFQRQAEFRWLQTWEKDMTLRSKTIFNAEHLNRVYFQAIYWCISLFNNKYSKSKQSKWMQTWLSMLLEILMQNMLELITLQVNRAELFKYSFYHLDMQIIVQSGCRHNDWIDSKSDLFIKRNRKSWVGTM